MPSRAVSVDQVRRGMMAADGGCNGGEGRVGSSGQRRVREVVLSENACNNVGSIGDHAE